MGFLQWATDTINGITKHGWSLTAFLISLTALFRVRKVRKKLGKIFPMMADDDSEVKVYVTNQNIIMDNQRLIMKHLGVEGWAAEKITLSPNTAKNSLTSSWVEKLFARTVGVFIRKVLTIFLRGNQRMKKFYTSRKFLLTILTAVLVALNDALGWGMSQDTIITIAGVVVGYIAVEGANDIVKKPEVNSYDAKTLDTVRADSEDTGHTASH